MSDYFLEGEDHLEQIFACADKLINLLDVPISESETYQNKKEIKEKIDEFRTMDVLEYSDAAQYLLKDIVIKKSICNHLINVCSKYKNSCEAVISLFELGLNTEESKKNKQQNNLGIKYVDPPC